MKFISEISKTLGIEELGTSRVQYTVVDGAGGYFQNVKRILEFSEIKIVLAGRSGAVNIEGEKLRLGKYFAGDLQIFGDIVKVERID